MRCPYLEDATRIAAPPEKIADLPAGAINRHWTKNVIASPDSSRPYVTVGSNSNVGENGIANERHRAAYFRSIRPRNSRAFSPPASNPNGHLLSKGDGGGGLKVPSELAPFSESVAQECTVASTAPNSAFLKGFALRFESEVHLSLRGRIAPIKWESVLSF